MTSRPFYKCKPIRNLAALSLALGVSEARLQEIAQSASSRYRVAKEEPKSDGTMRQTYDARPPLKDIHRRIQTALLQNVSYPYYLTGSLKGQDYVCNAELHSDARIAICEDVQSFFPNTSHEVVFDIWSNFFGFSDDVAELLTSLSTKDGALAQGAITSPYLANLAFWRYEAQLHDKLHALGVQYSRYVDDIVVSSKRFLTKEEQTKIIGQLYGMLKKRGYSAKRSKHEIHSSGKRMVVTKLLTNKRPALPLAERSRIRTAVFQLENRVTLGDIGADISKVLDQVTGKVAKLRRLHPTEGKDLMARVQRARKVVASLHNP